MSPQTTHPAVPQPRSGRVTQMRAEFDAAFARPPARTGDLQDVLALRLGDERCLLRLRDLAGVIAHPLITAVPTAVAALVGLIGNRGTVVAAYDLCVLRGGEPTTPRWLVISAGEPSVGVTFEHFDGYRRIDRREPDAGRLIDLAAVIGTIRTLAGGHRPGGDHMVHSSAEEIE